MKARGETKVCSRCREPKSVEEFNRDRARTDGLNIYCRVCITASRKAKVDPEREVRAIDRAKSFEQLLEQSRAEAKFP